MEDDHTDHTEYHVTTPRNFDEREVTWTWCWGHLIFFQPTWWPKTTLSYVASKHFLHGLLEQVICVVPLSLYIILFDYLLVRADIDETLIILFGLFSCILGLWIFIEGLKYGLMPLSEKIGFLIPESSALPCAGAHNFVGPILFLIIGTGVTMAEPALLALQAIGKVVSVKRTPYLYYILTSQTLALSFSIGIGVGIAFCIGYYKIKYQMNFTKLILPTLAITIALSTVLMFDADLQTLLGLAWDCGAITTGEVTVPIIVGLGGGLASVENPFSGLGLVSLGSLFPIITVQIFCIIIRYAVPRESIQAIPDHHHIPWRELQGVEELIETLKITIPLIFFFIILIKFLFRSDLPRITLKNVFYHHSEYLKRLKNKGDVESSKFGKFNYLWPALIATVFGLYIFNIGLNAGLAKLGLDVGGDAPALFVEMNGVPALYGYGPGLTILLLFCWFLGYLATVAEPAMEILGTKVQKLTHGSFSKNLFIHSVSFGVGIGCILGLLKVIYRVFILYMIIPIYWLTAMLTLFSSETMIHMAWDGGAVTTGPVTVPLVMALGIAIAVETGSYDGFGILALASVCPITSVLACGVIIRCRGGVTPGDGPVDNNEIEMERVAQQPIEEHDVSIDEPHVLPLRTDDSSSLMSLRTDDSSSLMYSSQYPTYGTV